MTPADVTAARAALGLTAAALGRALELGGRDPGQQVSRWESGKAAIPGPARVALRYMLEAQASQIAQEASKPVQAISAPPEPSSPVTEALKAHRADVKARRRG